jgi:hypothetical protein
LRARIRFRWYKGRMVPISCFALSDMFSAMPCASGPVLMFCAPGLVYGGVEGDGSCFLCLRAGASFWRHRRRRVPFSCFALPDSFSEVPWASGPVFNFGAPVLIFGCIEGVGSRFHILPARTGFDGPEGDESRFHVLRAWSSTRGYRGCQL